MNPLLRRSNTLSLHSQRGAALMVMLVIFIIGLTTFLVGALSQSTLQLERNRNTTDVLAQAKDALIGRAASDGNVPGSLPCPDTNNDGVAEMLAGNVCPSYIGRLPWKTLGLPDLRDSAGERLWYALSASFRDYTGIIVNSDTLGTITVFAPDGTQLNNGAGTTGVVAVIIAPGNVLTRQGSSQQDRSSTGANTASNYLDVATPSGNTQDNAVFTGTSTATTGFIQGTVKDATGTVIVNDQILVITRDQLMPVVETRIAREVRSCLNNYAASNSNKYPWPAPVNNGYVGLENTMFGRIADTPNIDITTTTTTPITSNPQYNNVNNALNALQAAWSACTTSDGGSNPSNLNNAADTLIARISALTVPPYTNAFKTAALNAANVGTASGSCNNIEFNSNYNGIQTNLNSAINSLASMPPTTTTSTAPASGMTAAWPAGCFTNAPMNNYWPDWKELVCYQIDNNFTPGGTLGTANITINSTGSYRAAVALARRATGVQVRNNVQDITKYLEGVNQHAPTTPTLNFVTYKLIDQPTVNDLVLCLDGGGACQ